MQNGLTTTKTIGKAQKSPPLLRRVLEEKSSKIDSKLTNDEGYQLL